MHEMIRRLRPFEAAKSGIALCRYWKASSRPQISHHPFLATVIPIEDGLFVAGCCWSCVGFDEA